MHLNKDFIVSSFPSILKPVKAAQNWLVFCVFLGETWKIWLTHLFRATNTLPISFQCGWRESETGVGRGKNGRVLLPLHPRSEISTPNKFGWIWVLFVTKWLLSNWRVMTPYLNSSRGWCNMNHWNHAVWFACLKWVQWMHSHHGLALFLFCMVLTCSAMGENKQQCHCISLHYPYMTALQKQKQHCEGDNI